MKRPKFAVGEYYHVYNRGVDKRTIFKQPLDYARFVFGLLAFNDERQFANANFHSRYGYPISIVEEGKRILLVDILCFCLMPNHFHLILRPKTEGGISKFIQKVAIGHTNYFNQKYERNGVLFQGKFKAIHIQDDRYFKHLSRYIHLNPLELIESKWKETGIKNWSKADNFLRSYRWSSYSDYLNRPIFPGLVNKTLLSEIFGEDSEANYADFVRSWTQKDLEDIVVLR